MAEEKDTILILDDNEAIRESLVYRFEDFGWRVISAETAEEALELIADDPPRGAVVDMRLPGMDGIDFIRHAKKICPDLACVICTGSPEYTPPEDVASLPGVSSKTFAKPVTDLRALETEILNLIS